MTKLQDYFYLNRTGRYANPLNSNDRLPIVYGDLTDGVNGNWVLPCIDTVNFVYAFSRREVLSVANGNSINIYENDLLLDPALYSFSALNDYESKGNIATIDFAITKANSIITARGKGKPTTTGGATLMENVIDIVNDFLTVENSFSSSLFEASYKAKALQIFTAQAYKAAGVIAEDAEIWEIIINMMASFLGSAYLDGSGDMVLAIDNGTLSQYGQADIVRKTEAPLIEARQRLVNIINQCPCNYSYNYVTLEFKQETDATAHADAESQGIYGTRKPNTPYQFYWCRDLISVQTVQDIIVAKFKDPIFEIEIENQDLKHIGVDQGDIFIHSVDSLYNKNGDQLLNQYWKIIGVTADFSSNKIRFRALQTSYFLTIAYLADGTYLADGSIMAGGNRDIETIY